MSSLKAVIYTRVSTEDQADNGTSLETQELACLRKAADLQSAIVEVVKDEGVSGARYTTRAGIQTALAHIETGAASLLIVHSLSRLSREVEHQQNIKKRIERVGGRLVICDMPLEDTEEGNLMFGISGAFAQYERSVIRKRTMSGKKRRAEEGQQPQRSRSPYGYHIVQNAEVTAGIYPASMRGRYIVDEEKSKIARRIFAGYAGRTESLPSLCKKLNAEGVPAPSGGVWHESTIRVILTNPVYKGQPVSGRHKSSTDEGRLQKFHALTGVPITTTDVRHLVPEKNRLILSAPPLVSEEVWNAAQERLATMKARYSGSDKITQMLSGMCICPHCGGRAILKYQKADGKLYRYFWCSSRRKARNLPGELPCKGDLYPVLVVEQATIRAVQEAAQQPHAMAAALRAYRRNQSRTPDNAEAQREMNAIAKALATIAEEEAITVQAQIAGIRGGVSPDAYTAAFSQLTARRKELEGRRAALQSVLALPEKERPQERTDADLLQCALDEVAYILTDDCVKGAEKRRVLGTVVEKVLPHKEGADVVFVPNVLYSVRDEETQSLSSCHTICIGMRTQR